MLQKITKILELLLRILFRFKKIIIIIVFTVMFFINFRITAIAGGNDSFSLIQILTSPYSDLGDLNFTTSQSSWILKYPIGVLVVKLLGKSLFVIAIGVYLNGLIGILLLERILKKYLSDFGYLVFFIWIAFQNQFFYINTTMFFNRGLFELGIAFTILNYYVGVFNGRFNANKASKKLVRLASFSLLTGLVIIHDQMIGYHLLGTLIFLGFIWLSSNMLKSKQIIDSVVYVVGSLISFFIFDKLVSKIGIEVYRDPSLAITNFAELESNAWLFLRSVLGFFNIDFFGSNQARVLVVGVAGVYLFYNTVLYCKNIFNANKNKIENEHDTFSQILISAVLFNLIFFIFYGKINEEYGNQLSGQSRYIFWSFLPLMLILTKKIEKLAFDIDFKLLSKEQSKLIKLFSLIFALLIFALSNLYALYKQSYEINKFSFEKQAIDIVEKNKSSEQEYIYGYANYWNTHNLNFFSKDKLRLSNVYCNGQTGKLIKYNFLVDKNLLYQPKTGNVIILVDQYLEREGCDSEVIEEKYPEFINKVEFYNQELGRNFYIYFYDKDPI